MNNKIDKIIFYSFLIVIILITIVFCIGAMQAWILYSDKPITEVPMWAMYFLRR